MKNIAHLHLNCAKCNSGHCPLCTDCFNRNHNFKTVPASSAQAQIDSLLRKIASLESQIRNHICPFTPCYLQHCNHYSWPYYPRTYPYWTTTTLNA